MQFQLGVGHKVAVTGHLRKQPSEGLLEAGGSLPRWLTHVSGTGFSRRPLFLPTWLSSYNVLMTWS